MHPDYMRDLERLVALNAGPRHPAYLHATWRAHINAMTFHRFITGETQ